MGRIKELIFYREMLWSLIKSELRTRYKGSILGFLWTFVNPILMLIVYNTVFSTVLRFNIPNYVSFLFIGLLAWNLFATSVQSSTSVIIRQSSLVKKVYFPREILPLAVVGGSAINYVLSLVILYPFLCLSGIRISWTWAYSPIIVVIELLFTSGLALLFAALNVFYRDVEHMLGILMMAWFYITPVFYSMSMIPAQYRYLYNMNPMSTIILLFQDIYYYHRAPDFSALLNCAVISLLVLVCGWLIFNRMSKRFAEEV